MAKMRDKLIYDYIGVNLEVVWRAVKDDVPELQERLSNILKNKSD